MVSSLKSELAAQKTLGQQSRTLQKQLKDRDTEVAQLKTQAEEAESQLSSAQSEIKALQTKLAAARNTAAGLESAVKAPGSAIKGGAANRATAAVTAEAAQSAQLAQLKEDLYSDLTGLIIRDVKSRDEDHLYDCIQTGVNGSKWLSPYSNRSQKTRTDRLLNYTSQLFMSNWLFRKQPLVHMRKLFTSIYHFWTQIGIVN